MSVIAVKQFTTAQEVRENARRIEALRRASYQKPKQPVLAILPKVEPEPEPERPASNTLQLTPNEISTILLMRASAEPLIPSIIQNSISRIIRAVSRFYKISVVDLLSIRRTNEIVRPRMVVYYLCRRLTTKSMPEIARRLGGRDHTTILSGFNRIVKLRSEDPELDQELTRLEGQLAP